MQGAWWDMRARGGERSWLCGGATGAVRCCVDFTVSVTAWHAWDYRPHLLLKIHLTFHDVLMRSVFLLYPASDFSFFLSFFGFCFFAAVKLSVLFQRSLEVTQISMVVAIWPVAEWGSVVL